MLQHDRTTVPARRKASRFRTAAKAAAMLALVAAVSLYIGLLATANQTYTITDGDSTTIHSSATADVRELLAEAGIEVDDDDRITRSDGTICIQRNQTVTVNCDGQALSASTYEGTVEDVLDQLDIALDQGDYVSSQGRPLSLSTAVYDGMFIDVTKTSQTLVTEFTEIPYDTLTYLDPTMELGAKVVKTPGELGRQETTYCENYVNGTLSGTATVGTRVVKAPVTEVILVGSGAEPVVEAEASVTVAPSEEEAEAEAETGDSQEADDETWDESDSADTEDARTVSEPEVQEPVYEEPEPQESYAEPETGSTDEEEPEETDSGDYVAVLSVEATAYCGGGTTATGTQARYGAIAVDPTVIPYGTKMYIVSDDGQWIYGEATAEDCGGAIKGYIIDLYFDDYNTCIQFGRRNCTVYVIEWG